MAFVKLTRLLAWLNKSPIKETDNALYQTIRELVKEIQILKDTVATLSPDTLITTINNPTSFILLESGEGGDGGDTVVVPGPVGATGAIGAGGPAGPTTIGPMGIDGTDGDDGYPLPGPQGLTGPQGIQGPVGPPTIGPMGLDGEDGADGYPIPGPPGADGSGGSGGGWELIATQVAAGAANYDFINLSAYNEIRVLLQNVVPAGAVEVTLLVSTDNGSTFLSASGDYINIATSGAPTNTTNLRFYNAGAAAGRYGQIIIMGFNIPEMKIAISHIDANLHMRVIPTTSPLNAIRVRTLASTMTSGNIFVFGR